jgi:hypothetical protein
LEGKKTIYKNSEKPKDKETWDRLRRHEIYLVKRDIKTKIEQTDFKVLLEDEKKLTERDINALYNWIVSVVGRANANTIWVKWLQEDPEMNQIITGVKERAARAAAAEKVILEHTPQYPGYNSRSGGGSRRKSQRKKRARKARRTRRH